MPYSQNLTGKMLKDFIRNDSLTMFKLLGIDSSFVNHPVEHWNVSGSYCHDKEVLAKLPAVNQSMMQPNVHLDLPLM